MSQRVRTLNDDTDGNKLTGSVSSIVGRDTVDVFDVEGQLSFAQCVRANILMRMPGS